MKLKSILSLTLVLVLNYVANSQEGLPVYTDYLTDNYYLIHPSMAGAANCGKARLTGRQNWFGQDDAPRLMTLNAHSRIGDSPSAIGAIVFADKNGFHKQTAAYVTYAHHLMFSRSRSDLNMLSFGLSAGILSYRLDTAEIVNSQPIPDPIVQGDLLSNTNFNMDFGFSYHFLDFYLHGTLKNLLKNQGVNNDSEVTSNMMLYLFSVGGVISMYGSEWSFEPSLMYQYRDLTEESSVDFNLKVYKDMDFGKVWGGLSYRSSIDKYEGVSQFGEDIEQKLNHFTPIIGVNYDKFMFAYNYTYQANELVYVNGGFHQITLGIDFNCRKAPYDCKCPAVN